MYLFLKWFEVLTGLVSNSSDSSMGAYDIFLIDFEWTEFGRELTFLVCSVKNMVG